jgi:hypothetical protein
VAEEVAAYPADGDTVNLETLGFPDLEVCEAEVAAFVDPPAFFSGQIPWQRLRSETV